MSITLSYFSGAPAYLPSNAYIVMFQSNKEKLVSVFHGDWLQSLPFMEHFIQLITNGPLNMVDGDILITHASDPADHIENMIFVHNEAIIPSAKILLPALEEALFLKCSIVTVLFESPEAIAEQQKYAFQLFMILKHFVESHETTTMEIRVCFEIQQSYACRIFQEQGVPFLGIK